MRTTILFILLLAITALAHAADDKSKANAKLTEVTVYRLGAEMQQTFKAAISAKHST